MAHPVGHEEVWVGREVVWVDAKRFRQARRGLGRRQEVWAGAKRRFERK